MTDFVVVQGEPLAVVLFEAHGVQRGTAVLCHGFTGTKEDFRDFGPALARRGYRVLAFDSRGVHESAHSARTDAYDMASTARDARLLAEHYGMDRPHLLGHSFGGLVAQRAVVDAPDCWRSLTIFCSGPDAIPGGVEFVSGPAAHYAEPPADAPITPEHREFLRRRWHATDPRALRRHAEQLGSAEPILDAVRATGVPVHVVYGEHDDAWPPRVQDDMAAVLGAPVSVIAGAGHLPNEERPEYTADVVADFWDAH